MYSNISFFTFNYNIYNENNWGYIIKKLYLFYKNIILNSNNILINYYTDNSIKYYSNNILYEDFNFLNNFFKTDVLFIIFNQSTIFLYYFLYFEFNNFIINSNNFNINLYTYLNFFFISMLFFIIIFFIVLIFFFDYSAVQETTRIFFLILYEEFILIWIRIISIKFESIEEAICIIILWPWCIFLIFTHIFTVDNNEIFFIFIEWGLPIIYGYLILIENIILFGSYFFVYLNGSRNRKLLIITLIEDIISFIILLARITLQIVRGLICGLYHDFFRELIEFITDNWELYWFYVLWQVPFFKNYYSIDFFFFYIDWYIISFTLLFIYIILFLQLLFLLIAVWLFCRCWFISTRSIVNKFNKYDFNLLREINLFKTKITNLFNF